MDKSVKSAIARESPKVFATRLGCDRSISGYIYHTVPIVIQVWLRHQHDYRQAVIEIIRLGGDTDTTFLRNLVFLLIVIFHGFCRLLRFY
ncbi:MAG: ADP-ribosylglycohydrolase family protein [Hydrococcus sp. Prado102]|nr:ADP-ribosylglycohydrolase family protein [Hydrococcus sp. Prado102]